MAQDEVKFSHITVTPDDDDDFVIQAGVRPPSSTAEEPEPVALEPEPAPEPVAERKDDYRETTAEDLELAPMSLMQKVIIVLAAAAVVAVVAYVVTH